MAENYRDIVCGGDPEPHFTRLGVSGTPLWKGWGWGGRLSVYRVSKRTFDQLCLDQEDALWTESGAWWRWSPGSIMGTADFPVLLNGTRLYVWAYEDQDEPYDEYAHVLAYLDFYLGATTEKNITALVTDLARYNNLDLGSFMAAAQGDVLKPKAGKHART